MRFLAVLLTTLVFAVPLVADDLTIKGLERGKAYIIEVAADGAVTVNVTRVVTVGTTPGNPTDPAGSFFQQEIARQTKIVLDQGGSKTTAAALSTVYSLVGDKVADGSIPVDQALPAIKAASNLVLNDAEDGPAWDGWRAKVSAALTRFQQEGNLTTKAQLSSTFKEIAAGMNAASGYKPTMIGNAQAPGKGILSGIDIDKLIKIIELIMQLLKLFGIGG